MPHGATAQIKIPAVQRELLDTKPQISAPPSHIPTAQSVTIEQTGDAIIDANLKVIKEKAPPLPAHLLNPATKANSKTKAKPSISNPVTMATTDNSNSITASQQPIAYGSDSIPAFASMSQPKSQSIQKITAYDGSTDFHAFTAKFEVIAQCCQWNEQHKLLNLVGLLTGKALDCYAWQEPEVRNEIHLLSLSC